MPHVEALASPGLFEEDRSNLSFDDEASAPIAAEPESRARSIRVAAPIGGVAGVTAVPASAQEISLPISLEIGGKSIRFHLRVSLDLASAPVIEGVEEEHRSGTRS